MEEQRQGRHDEVPALNGNEARTEQPAGFKYFKS